MGAIKSEGCPRWSAPHTRSPNFASETTSAGHVPSAALEGRGPEEMRVGLNMIRITAEAERDWQRRMQEPQGGPRDQGRRARREGRRRRRQKLQACQQQRAARPAR